MSSLTDSILQAVAANAEWAWLVVFLIAFAESMAIIGLLIPGWVLLVGIGTLIGTDALEFTPIVISAYFGAVIGEYLSFFIGFHYRDSILHWKMVARHQSLVNRSRLLFEKYGAIGVFFGRFIGPVRAVIPLIAGISGMSKRTFFWINISSGLIWAPLYLIPGILIGAAFELGQETASMLLFIFTILAIVLWMAISFSKKMLISRSQKLPKRKLTTLNACLAWSIFIFLLVILINSEFYQSFIQILSLLKSKII